MTGDSRRAELQRNLEHLRGRIGAAAADSGRAAGEITLIAVTKTFPASDVRLLADLGLRDFGENRDQEARPKAAAAPECHWHFLGRLQRNKARSVSSYAGTVHSVDRPELIAALDRGAVANDRTIEVFLQLSLDSATHRGGASPTEILDLAAQVQSAERLQLVGLMAVPPLDVDPDQAYSECAAIRSELIQRYPQAGAFSAGMSADLESAIRHGATHVRVGTALLGGRPRLLR
ncbi:MAG TPA: YggS family pyridoxal phosphate-dependent enzyme [Mycobacteriales bacterium]|nr:YggS family pyridoxal phosphate-dependent enzyme [Mycobacteriales bacterium]